MLFKIMKKIFIIFLFLSLVGLVSYVLIGKFRKNNDIDVPTYIDFNPDFLPQQATNKPTPDITTILKQNISPALDAVIKSIYRDNYYILTCSDEIGGGQALMVTAKYDGSISRDGYEKAYQTVKGWEKNAVAEIGHIVFPELAQQTASINFVWFEPYTVNNPHITASRDFHKALFYIGENPYEMHYGWILNYVIFAPSQKCLEATMEALYSDH